jgi:D-3-phosphoglycerate dehydrogenase
MTQVPLIYVGQGTFSELDDVKGWFAGAAEIREIPVTPEAVEVMDGEPAGLVVGLQRVDEPLLDALPATVRAVSRAGIGLDSIDLHAAAARDVAVIYQPDYATQEVATHAVALMLALNRCVVAGDLAARTDWADVSRFGEIKPVEECVVGVVGLGRIGSAVVHRIRPLAAGVVAFDPQAKSVPTDVQLTSSLDELLARADIVTLHLPLGPETLGLIGRRELLLLPEHALLVNVSRGGLIDEDALADALLEGRLAGAALDVLEQEPPPLDARILRAPNVLLSPHVAWMSRSAQERLKKRAVQALLDFAAGRSLSAGSFAVPTPPGTESSS